MRKNNTPRPTLLIVEDEEYTREGMAKLLERDGYRVITAADEREALENARLIQPDLILVDMDKSSRDLLSVGGRVRAEVNSTAAIPIVAFAGRADEIVGEGGEVSIGDNQYVTLPEDFYQLEKLIARLLDELPSAA